MMETATPTPARKPRSQKRQRGLRVVCWVNANEKMAIEAKAERAGLSGSSYLKTLVFGKDAPKPRGARRPVVEKELLVRVLGELGKIGSNVNQIAHVANQGRGVDYPAFEQLLSEVLVMRDQVKAALGREKPAAPLPPPVEVTPPQETEPTHGNTEPKPSPSVPPLLPEPPQESAAPLPAPVEVIPSQEAEQEEPKPAPPVPPLLPEPPPVPHEPDKKSRSLFGNIFGGGDPR